MDTFISMYNDDLIVPTYSIYKEKLNSPMQIKVQ